MKIKAGKYFVASLSILLILSNFSFATTVMLCDMDMDAGTCSCSQNPHKDINTPVIKKLKDSCCDSETLELSNSNLLFSIKNDLTGNTLNLIDFISNNEEAFAFNSGVYHYLLNGYSYHLPNSDIPIINSSLLI